MMLWQHEFYMVIEPDPHKPSGAPMPYLYQALEFNLGPNLDPEDVEWAGAKQKKEVWVRGVAHAPALHVRKLNREKMREGYLFHTECRVERRGRGHGVVWGRFRGCAG